jgi:hypothetical protein
MQMEVKKMIFGMFRKKELLALMVLVAFRFLPAEINVNKYAGLMGKPGLNGNLSAAMTLTSGEQDSILLQSDLGVVYSKDVYKLLAAVNVLYQYYQQQKLFDQNSVHFSIGREWGNRLNLKLFIQNTKDRFRLIKQRLNIGSVLDMKLIDKAKSETQKSAVSLKAGIGIMFEAARYYSADPVEDTTTITAQDDMRAISNLTWNWEPADTMSLVVTGQYEVNLNQFSDFRVNGEALFKVGVLKSISIVINLANFYDNSPLLPVNQYNMRLMTGFQWDF